MNEFMGLIRGVYEAKQDGFLPGAFNVYDIQWGVSVTMQQQNDRGEWGWLPPPPGNLTGSCSCSSCCRCDSQSLI